jgi:hypothetical protein
MSLESGDNTTGVYEGSFNVNSTYFDEDGSYKLQIKAENTNGLTDTETITWYADSTPESGIVLGGLNQISDEVRCGNWTEDIAFKATLTFAESHYTYTKTITNTQWEDQLVDFELITSYSCSHENLTDLEIYRSGSNWKLKLIFDEEPEEDSTTTITIYEEEPKITNPEVVEIGTEHLVLSLDVTTERDFDNCHIGEQVFPSDLVKSAWWSNYKIIDYAAWKVYSDEDLRTELEANVTAWTSETNEYEAHIDIQGLSLTTDITTLYIQGTLKEQEIGFRVNIPGLFFVFLMPFGGYTFFLVFGHYGKEIDEKKKKLSLIALTIVGIALAIVFQFFDPTKYILSIWPEVSMPELSIPSIQLPEIQFPTMVFVLFTPTTFVVLLILSSRMLQRGFSEKQIIQMVLADIIAEVILLILYVRGTLQLAITELETSELMLINISLGLMIAFAIVIGTAFVIKINQGEVPFR